MTKPLLFALLPLTTLLAQGPNSDRLNDEARPGAVYIMTNTAPLNRIVTFHRAADGQLTWEGSLSTGGVGTGSALGSDNAVQLSKDHQWLFTVNAGNNSISVDLPHVLRQTVKAQISSNGELSHGIVSQAVHERVQGSRRPAAGARDRGQRGGARTGGEPEHAAQSPHS